MALQQLIGHSIVGDKGYVFIKTVTAYHICIFRGQGLFLQLQKHSKIRFLQNRFRSLLGVVPIHAFIDKAV